MCNQFIQTETLMFESHRIPYKSSALPVHGAKAVLVVAPHPDDEVFGCGGCAALYAIAGVPVHVLVLTDGGFGGIAGAGEDLVVTRYQEVVRAGEILGYEQPIFANHQDRSLQQSIPAVADLIIQQLKLTGADVLFAPSLWEIHPDHHAAAMAALQAIKSMEHMCTLVQYEVGAPLLPNKLVDITSVLAKKQQAMECFVSQLAVQAYDRHINSLNVFRTYTLGLAVQSAEGVRVATFVEAENDPYGLIFEGNPHPVKTCLPLFSESLPWYKKLFNR